MVKNDFRYNRDRFLDYPPIYFSIFSWIILILIIFIHRIADINPKELTTVNLLINLFINTPLVGLPSLIGIIEGCLNILGIKDRDESRLVSAAAVVLGITAFTVLIKEFPNYISGGAI